MVVNINKVIYLQCKEVGSFTTNKIIRLIKRTDLRFIGLFYLFIMFRKVLIDNHSSFCIDKKGEHPFNYNQRHFCEVNLDKILFQIETDFYLVLMPKCIIDDKFENIVDLVKSCIKSRKTKDTIYESYVNKSISNKELQDLRIRGLELKKWMAQVHYIYSNAAKKVFNITSEVLFKENWLGTWNYDLNLSYLDAKEYLKNDKYLLNQLEELYETNLIKDYTSEIEVFKTIDSLTKKIRKTIKNK
jgi:hypothetical protein